MDDVVFFSGGISSWALAKRVAQKHGTENLRLLFTDTKIEDEDLYRFLKEAASNVGGCLEIVADGRNIWDVFRDRKLLGNSRVAPCSEILKQKTAKKWLSVHYPDPSKVRLWLGMNWDEAHRLVRSKKHWLPYQVDSLLMEEPFLLRSGLISLLKNEGIRMPRLYELGFAHNNCGGGCVRAGQAHFRHLLKMLPEVYSEWEQKEEEMRVFLKKDVSILKDRRGGKVRPLTLKQLRQRDDSQCDLLEWGGCGCFTDGGD